MTVVKQPSEVTVTQDVTQLFVHPGLEVKCAVSLRVEKVALRRAEVLVFFQRSTGSSNGDDVGVIGT